jgi:hypothetical protein
MSFLIKTDKNKKLTFFVPILFPQFLQKKTFLRDHRQSGMGAVDFIPMTFVQNFWQLSLWPLLKFGP